MARPLRIHYPGAVYHMTVRGDDRQDLFRDDRDLDPPGLRLEHVPGMEWMGHLFLNPSA